MGRNGEKMKNVVGSTEKKVTGSYVKDFRKAKHDPGRKSSWLTGREVLYTRGAKQDSRYSKDVKVNEKRVIILLVQGRNCSKNHVVNVRY